jgi:hypothetical protein
MKETCSTPAGGRGRATEINGKFGNLTGKRTPKRPSCRWKDIKTDLDELSGLDSSNS